MRNNGYDTPIEYFELSLNQLKSLADKGNIFASIQLGQQYMEEFEHISNQSGVENDMPPQKIAIKYFSAAAIGGATQPIVYIAAHLATSNPPEAYTWALLGEKLGVKGSISLRKELSSKLNASYIANSTILAERKFEEFSAYTLSVK